MALILRFREIEKLVNYFTKTYPKRRGNSSDKPLTEIEEAMNDIYKDIKSPQDKRTYNRFIKTIEDYYSSDKFREVYGEKIIKRPDVEKFTDVETSTPKVDRGMERMMRDLEEREKREEMEEREEMEARKKRQERQEREEREEKKEEVEEAKMEEEMPVAGEGIDPEMEAIHDQIRKDERRRVMEEFGLSAKEETEEPKEETKEETKEEPEVEVEEETEVEVEEPSTDTIPKEENVNMMIMKDREVAKDDPTIGDIQIPKERLGIMGKNIKELNDDIKYFTKRFPDILKLEADAYKKIDKKNLLALQDIHRRIQAKLLPDGEKKEGRIGIILDADKFIDMKISELLAAKTLEGLTPANLVDITEEPKSQGRDIGSFTITKNRAGRDVINNAPVYRSIPTTQPPKPMRRGEIKQETIYKNSGKDKVDIAKMEMASNPFIRRTKVSPLNIIL